MCEEIFNKGLYDRLCYLWENLNSLRTNKIDTSMHLMLSSYTELKHTKILGDIKIAAQKLRFYLTKVDDVNSTIRLSVFEPNVDSTDSNVLLDMYITSFGEISLVSLSLDLDANQIDKIIKHIENIVDAYSNNMISKNDLHYKKQSHMNDVLKELARI